MAVFHIYRRLHVSFLCCFLLFFQPVFAQKTQNDLQVWMEKNLTDLGGRAVLLISKNGQLVYNRSLNLMSQKQETAGKMKARLKGIDEDVFLRDFNDTTRERIASSSKWLTAALVMTFIDENKLRLNDTVGKYLPVLSKAGKGNIRIWHCLSHTTGIKDGGLRESLMLYQKVKTMDEYLEQISLMPVEGPPGKVFRYGNTGLQIAAAVLEKISGKDFETLFKERIAEPLNMHQTDFGKQGVPLAAGGAWSTPKDYMNFLQMIQQEGLFEGKQIISKALIQEMQKNKITRDCIIAYSPIESGNWGYGFGEWITNTPLAISNKKDAMPESERATMLSSPGLFGSYPWIDRKNNIIGFLFVFNLKYKNRQETYNELCDLASSIFTN
jgi:CubicO group peptidase (beta-lactamase class C family)